MRSLDLEDDEVSFFDFSKDIPSCTFPSSSSSSLGGVFSPTTGVSFGSVTERVGSMLAKMGEGRVRGGCFFWFEGVGL